MAAAQFVNPLTDAQVQELAREWDITLDLAYKAAAGWVLCQLWGGFEPRIISGRRSSEEQARLWSIGRDTRGRVTGQVVTNARPGQSKHELGEALDWDYPPEQRELFGRAMEQVGLKWGGRFHSPPLGHDYPHTEIP